MKVSGPFTFHGAIDGVSLQALITPTGTLRYEFVAVAERISLTGTVNPVAWWDLALAPTATSVNALIFH
jgi:hypothetical protein